MPIAASENSLSKELWPGLKSMAELHEWEVAHMPFIQTTSGRSLYFALIRTFVLNQSALESPLKSFALNLTGKIMRERMREFENLGLLTLQRSGQDGRVRTVALTERMHEVFRQHTQAIRHYGGKRHIFIRKDGLTN